MEDLILKHALKNALGHEGKADEKAVIGKVLAEDPSLKQRIKEVIQKTKEIVSEINKLSFNEIKERAERLGISLEEKKKEEKLELPPLPQAEKGKVVMRLAPFPSGPLHIGNARMVILNDEYVKEYKGKLLLVFDDTMGSEEKRLDPEAYDLILDGLEWLGVKFDKIIYKSDRVEIFYRYARKLIEKGYAYVCECPVEVLRKNRKLGVECKCRKNSVEENLEKWEKMLSGEYKEGEAVLRIKTDMNHPDPAFRDRVLLRIVEKEHPRVGDKYRVWPMLEFSWAIDDHLLGITHILRGKDLVIEDMMEEFIWKIFGWKRIPFIHYGLLRIKEAKLSKSKARAAIEKGLLRGWNDPRTWSLQSLRERGIQPQAIRNFILRMGLSLADVTLPAEILYAENRKIIDSIANRYFCVINPVKISIESKIKIKKVRVVLHPDFPERGKRTIPVDTKSIYIEKDDFEKFKGKEVGLAYFCTIKLGKKSKFVSSRVKYEVPKIHWVSEPHEKVKILMPDGKEVKAFGEPLIKKLKEGEIIQLFRVGFCRIGKDILHFAHK